ncbi:kinase-like domain-containing protein [Fomitopsis serialis]|uniref:kinase-like domain-containing protein n=1 Tax=Fomitopsis serialis TaxID=139415 RepID=UPI002007BF6A|nr:kinase-like domain-containing protein [Neoantrodia serialis]KAH9910373.1 kinase-like domain-containing protein [Neoantrodia serialis]
MADIWRSVTNVQPVPWKRWLLFLLTYPLPGTEVARGFRFGIPWVVKICARTTSTEAHALRFLESTRLALPIPRLIFAFAECGATYTIMSRIPGISLKEVRERGLLSLEAETNILTEVTTVLDQMQTLRQPPGDEGKVMMSTSGHDLPDPRYFHETRSGPFPSALQLWVHCASYDDIEEFKQDIPLAVQEAVTADPIRFVHPDLRMYNVLIHDNHVSAIIDWEDSGWLPSSWQVHTMRHIRLGCRGFWSEHWRKRHRFTDEAEAAYAASMTFLTKLPT